MSARYFLGIDQGTTGITAILFNEKWNPVSCGYQEIRQIYPRAGWVEHDAIEIWRSVCAAVANAMKTSGVSPSEVACLGIDHEGESVVLWNRITGKPIYNAIVWQDRRTARQADNLNDKYGEIIYKKTGLWVDSYFSATKIQWILDNVSGARKQMASGQLLTGTMDSWLLWKMTHGRVHSTDASTASRTMLYNVDKQQWDEDLLELFGINLSMMPEINDSANLFGRTAPIDFLGLDIPISGVLVDQQAALFGQACVSPGAIKTTYGTGCFMLMNTGSTFVRSSNGLLPTIAWQLDGLRSFALDGGIYISGAATQWLRDGLKIIRSPSETEAMAYQAGDNGGVFFVPAFTGLAAPYWDSYARGMMIGITGGTTKEHIVRATLESTAYQVKDVIDVMQKDSGVSVSTMRCDGGAIANTFLMQFQADILGIPLDIPEVAETTALGAAFMGALGIGEFANIEDIKKIWKRSRCYEPQMSTDQRDSLMYHWHRAVDRATCWDET